MTRKLFKNYPRSQMLLRNCQIGAMCWNQDPFPLFIRFPCISMYLYSVYMENIEILDLASRKICGTQIIYKDVAIKNISRNFDRVFIFNPFSEFQTPETRTIGILVFDRYELNEGTLFQFYSWFIYDTTAASIEKCDTVRSVYFFEIICLWIKRRRDRKQKNIPLFTFKFVPFRNGFDRSLSVTP